MKYPMCIEWGDENTAFGIQIPDIPGAITAGDTFDEAHTAAVEIAHIMLQEIAAGGGDIPTPTAMAGHVKNPDFAGMGWGMLEIDITPYLGKTEKVNVTLPGSVIQQIDKYVETHNLKSRSTFLAETALRALQLKGDSMSVRKISYLNSRGEKREVPTAAKAHRPESESALYFACRTICIIEGLPLKAGSDFSEALISNGITEIEVSFSATNP
ncbi:type II toxin-antitoxin system HicB family antitoxin [Pseudomonas cichorii]|nr:type II toxin-antitoxin system HicB family antitoxin [Pseudomonas cichorii]